MSETEIQQHIRGTLNAMGSPVRVFRNNVGTLQDKDGRYVTFGLAKGSGDLIGIEKRVITPEMVGQIVGVFVSVEVKTPVGRLSKEQKSWLNVVRRFGGEAHVWRTVQEAEEYLRGRQ